MCFADIFSQSVTYLFILLIVSFTQWMAFILVKSKLPVFLISWMKSHLDFFLIFSYKFHSFEFYILVYDSFWVHFFVKDEFWDVQLLQHHLLKWLFIGFSLLTKVSWLYYLGLCSIDFDVYFFCQDHTVLITLLYYVIVIYQFVYIHKVTCWDFRWDCIESVDPIGKKWHLNNKYWVFPSVNTGFFLFI